MAINLGSSHTQFIIFLAAHASFSVRSPRLPPSSPPADPAHIFLAAPNRKDKRGRPSSLWNPVSLPRSRTSPPRSWGFCTYGEHSLCPGLTRAALASCFWYQTVLTKASWTGYGEKDGFSLKQCEERSVLRQDAVFALGRSEISSADGHGPPPSILPEELFPRCRCRWFERIRSRQWEVPWLDITREGRKKI